MTKYEPAQVANATGLSLDTLRYYEREGLIGPIERSSGGRRCYDEDDVSWIGIVTCLREAGLGIAELRRFTVLLRTAGPSKDRAEFLRERREELQERLRQMQAALTVLDGKIAHYSALTDDPKG
jgi:DNA-binding transcriptional MerR regulator